MADITQTYWYKKAKELEEAGETTEAQRYKIMYFYVFYNPCKN